MRQASGGTTMEQYAGLDVSLESQYSTRLNKALKRFRKGILCQQTKDRRDAECVFKRLIQLDTPAH
jgi:hypothetical protein